MEQIVNEKKKETVGEKNTINTKEILLCMGNTLYTEKLIAIDEMLSLQNVITEGEKCKNG